MGISSLTPNRWNIKNPAGDYVQHDRNVEVFRQISQAKAKREKDAILEERQKAIEENKEVEVVSPKSLIW